MTAIDRRVGDCRFNVAILLSQRSVLNFQGKEQEAAIKKLEQLKKKKKKEIKNGRTCTKEKNKPRVLNLEFTASRLRCWFVYTLKTCKK